MDIFIVTKILCRLQRNFFNYTVIRNNTVFMYALLHTVAQWQTLNTDFIFMMMISCRHLTVFL